MIFADPPYFLSNGGITCHAGKMVKVDKGAWDKSRGPELNHEFNTEWLRRCQALLKPNGTLWVSGTHHVIFSIGYAMQQLGMKLLNQVTWQKPNPPPNLACRYFTHSTETVLWAAKDENSRHRFNYADMKRVNGDKQMKDVWTFTASKPDEKRLGKQRPERRIVLEQGPVDLGEPAQHRLVGRQCLALRQKRPHHVDTHLHRLRAAQDICRHHRPVLSEGPGQIFAV